MAKFVFVAILGILCINMSIYLVNAYSLLPGVSFLTPLTPGEISSKVNINGTITPDPNYVNAFYDIWGGMSKLWTLFITLVAGLPILMAELGTPGPVVLVIDAIYTFLVGVFFIELVLGRDVGD